MPLYARKRDTNEPEIIEGLRALGCYVIQENNIDLYVLPPNGVAFVPMEVKTKNGKLTSYQKKLHADLRDNYNFEIPIVKSLDDAMRILGLNEGYAYIPNNRTATCTRKGKIEVIKNFVQSGDILYLGMTHVDKNNGRNLDAPIINWGKFDVTVKYPLIEQNIEPHTLARELGLLAPRMYTLGYKHANCGGCCVKQGRGDWIRTLINFPERFTRYEKWESKQRHKQMIRILCEMILYKSINPIYIMLCKISSMYAFVKTTSNGETRPLPLSEIREQYESGKQINFFYLVDELDGYSCTIDCGIGNNEELEIVFNT